jgi:hypothetical protein
MLRASARSNKFLTPSLPDLWDAKKRGGLIQKQKHMLLAAQAFVFRFVLVLLLICGVVLCQASPQAGTKAN